MLAIHPNARTTPAVRAEIARSTERPGVLAALTRVPLRCPHCRRRFDHHLRL